MRKIDDILLAAVLVVSVLAMYAFGGTPVITQDQEGRISTINRNLIELENLGGKHIKPKKITCREFRIYSAGKLYLDGGDDTYIYESSSDIISFVAGGVTVLTLDGAGETGYLTLSPGNFVFTTLDGFTDRYVSIIGSILNSSSLSPNTFFAGVNLPNGAVVTSVKAYWRRASASATGYCRLERDTFNSSVGSTMASVNSDSSSGDHSVEDTSISNATIDNTTYMYQMILTMDADSDVYEVGLYAVKITYTED